MHVVGQDPSDSLAQTQAQTQASKCSPDICSRIRCALPKCENGTTLVEGAGFCGCCPGCVTPGRYSLFYAKNYKNITSLIY